MTSSKTGSLRNNYWILLDKEWRNLTEDISGMGWGKDYYANVFRLIETNGCLSGSTFYLTKTTPDELPSYGERVVLVVIGDEYYGLRPYFLQLQAIIRCYGSQPRYLDGVPTNALKMKALLQFGLKLTGYLKDLWRSTRFSYRDLAEIRLRTLQVPLGCFGAFDETPLEFRQRTIDYAFLGSVHSDKRPWYSLRGLISPPKIVARTRMMKELSQFSMSSTIWNGNVSISNDFLDSISKKIIYAETMKNCKISICPRGTNYETYRFNESCKMGCVVICEPIPKVWFHENHPGIIIDDWKALPKMLEELLGDQERLNLLSEASRKFWEEHLCEEVVAKKIEMFLLGCSEAQ